MGPVESVLDGVQSNLATALLDGYNALAASLDTTLYLLLVIMVLIYGYAMFFGKIDMPVKTAMTHVLKAIVVVVLTTQAAYFTAFVVPIVIDGPNEVAGAVLSGVSGGSVADGNQALDDFFQSGIEAAQKIIDQSGGSFILPDIGAWLLAVIVVGAVSVVTGVALFLVVLALVAVTVLLILTPVFFPLLLFSATRGIFEGWMRQTITFALVPVFVYTAVALLMSVAQGFIEDILDPGTTVDISTVAPLLLICIATMLVFVQVLGWAGAIGGGASLSTMGAISSAIRGGRRAAASPVTGARSIRDMRDARRRRAMTKDSYQQLRDRQRKPPPPPPPAPK